VVFTILYRIVVSDIDRMSNTSPTMALCFGVGLLMGRRFWWMPALLIIASDWLIGLRNSGQGGLGAYTILSAVLFCGATWFGSSFSRWNGKTWPTMWAGVLFSSVVFYLAANTFSFLAFPGYPKTIGGWWMSQTTGLAGFPPSWAFLRNAIIADSIWCVVAGFLFFFKFSPARAAIADEPATVSV